MRTKLGRVAGMLGAVSALLLAGCGGDDDASDQTSTNPDTSVASEGTSSSVEDTVAGTESTQVEDTVAGTESTQPGAPDVPLADVTVGANFSISDAPLFIAEAKGYYDEEGLDVEFLPFRGLASQIAALATGELDVGAGAVASPLLNAVEQGIDLRIVAGKGSSPDGYGYAFLVRSELLETGEYNGFEDLAGMRGGIVAEGSGIEIIMLEALRAGGHEWTDFTPLYLGQAEQIAAMAAGDLDFSVLLEPHATNAVNAGVATIVETSDNIVPGLQAGVVIFPGEFADDDLSEAFLRALVRACEDYNAVLTPGGLEGEGADEIISIIADYTESDAEVVSQFAPQWIEADCSIAVDSIQVMIDGWQAIGSVGEGVTLEQLIDTQALEDARADG